MQDSQNQRILVFCSLTQIICYNCIHIFMTGFIQGDYFFSYWCMKGQWKPVFYSLNSFEIFWFAFTVLPGQVCQTPNNSSGSCEDLRACGSLFNLLKKAPLAQSDREHLQHSQCGYQNRSPLVLFGWNANNLNRFNNSVYFLLVPRYAAHEKIHLQHMHHPHHCHWELMRNTYRDRPFAVPHQAIVFLGVKKPR